MRIRNVKMFWKESNVKAMWGRECVNYLRRVERERRKRAEKNQFPLPLKDDPP